MQRGFQFLTASDVVNLQDGLVTFRLRSGL
jgi:hypothetical protein